LITFGSNLDKISNFYLPSLGAEKRKLFCVNNQNNGSNAVTNKIRLFFHLPLLSLLSNGAAAFALKGNS
jgi:hypothetical protein